MISCPSCGEDDDLRGAREDGIIAVVCGACGHRWERHLDPRCPTCGGTDLLAVSKAIVEKARGTQLSVVATTEAHLCRACDRDLVAELEHRPGGRLVMPDELPTVSRDD